MHIRVCLSLLAGLLLAGCSPGPEDLVRLDQVPAVNDYCVAAQRVVTRTAVPVQLVIQPDFDGFVKSKAVIEGPTIHQFNWTNEQGLVVGISCKLKSADHLNLVFGDGIAGPDGLCQDMNRAVFERLSGSVMDPAFTRVSFDPNEVVRNRDNPGMTGPDWLAPFTVTTVDEAGGLVIHSKGFQVDFTDPEVRQAPERFRGVHYCHFIAPDHLLALLQGNADAGIQFGRSPDLSRYSAPSPAHEASASGRQTGSN